MRPSNLIDLEDLDVPDVTGCAAASTTADPCPRCDLLLGLEAVHVEAVERTAELVTVTVATSWELMGCPGCGVVARSRGRVRRMLRDVPHGQVRVRLCWRQRRWRCPDPGCPVGTFAEQVPTLVPARGSITARAVGWAIGQLRAEHATIAGLARQSARHGRRCGVRSDPGCRTWLMTRPGSPAWSAWAWTSTCGITSTPARAARRS